MTNLDRDETKNTATSKINLTAASVIAMSVPLVEPFLEHAEELQAIVGSMLPVQYLPIFNIVAAIAIGIFRTFFQTRPLSMSGPLTLK